MLSHASTVWLYLFLIELPVLPGKNLVISAHLEPNLLNKKITRPVCLETTALGAAYLAGLATGYYKNLDEIKKNHEIDKFFLPFKNLDDRYKKWLKAVEATRVFK